MNIIQIFSTPIWESPFPDYDRCSPDFRGVIESYRQENPQGNPGRYIENGGYQSHGDLTLKPAMAPLYEYVAQISMKACFDMQFHPGNIFICQSWSVILDNHRAVVPEQTMGDTFTGVFFLDAPANSGKLQLRNPGMNPLWQGRGVIDRRNRFNAQNINIDPDPGMIFIWPSYLSHSISCNHHDESLTAIFFTTLLMPRQPESQDDPETQPESQQPVENAAQPTQES